MEKCEKYCNSNIKKTMKKTHNILDKMKKVAKSSTFKKMMNEKLKGQSKEIQKETKEKFAKFMNFKNPTINTDKSFFLESCKKQYCNKGCSETIFEDEPGTKYSKMIKSKYGPSMRNIFMTTRKKIFNGKKSVLNDNFYENLNKSDVKKAKKMGAISGCYRKIK